MERTPPASVDLEITDRRVAVVTIHRPEAKNALNLEVRRALAAIFDDLGGRADVGAVVLTGSGGVFVAGADLKEIAQASPVEIYDRRLDRLWSAISGCPLPVIAAVEGFALGGGCELAMHCDMIVAGRSVRFAQPEVKLGLMPGAGGTQRLVRAVGKFQAMRIALTGCMVGAEEALAMGLVSEVVGDGEVLARAMELAEEVAALPRVAVRQIKEVILAGADLPLDSALALERKAFQLLFDTRDQKEGAAAFLEKRRPHYEGR
jgi:enoyl-CoA hydratase/carnithine racemase